MSGDRRGLLHHGAVVEQLETAQAELARIKGSSSYQLGCDLETAINATLADPSTPITGLDEAIDAAYAKLHRQELERRAAPLIQKRAREMVQAETSQIDTEAEVIAVEKGKEARQRFHSSGEATKYRDQRIAMRARVLSAAAITAAQQEIDDEVGPIPEDTVAEVAEETTAERKHRAANILKRTKRTKILPYSFVQEDDVLTLGFARPGRGNASLTTPGGYYNDSRSYNSSEEVRHVAVRVVSREHGVFETVDDTWFSKGDEENGIRPGRQVILLANDPDTGEPESMLVKAKPVLIEAITGHQIPPTNNELWWVNLDNYRVLS